MQGVLDYLRKDKYKNVYIIRGVLNEVANFEVKVKYRDENIIGVAAIWKDEKKATLRGKKDFCKEWVCRLEEDYDFYELEEKLVNEFKKEIFKNNKIITSHLIMKFSSDNLLKAKERMEYRKLNKNEWRKVSEKYKKKYDIHFSPFQAANMEWLAVYDEGKVISNICLENVEDETYILSNFYTAPPERNRGVGTKFLTTVLNDYKENEFVLFVNEENQEAIRLYNRLGFEVCERVLDIGA